METGEIRFVWLLVFFDLPVTSKARMASANRFRNFLKKDGFMMLQLSVYARVCRGQDAVEKHLLRIRNALPSEGCVRSLQGHRSPICAHGPDAGACSEIGTIRCQPTDPPLVYR